MRYSEITEQDYSYSGRLRRNDAQIVRAILQTYSQALTKSSPCPIKALKAVGAV